MELTASEVKEITQTIKETNTVGELIRAIIAQVDKGEEYGRVAVGAYIDNMQANFPDKTLEECTEACHQNINYLVGYFDEEVRDRVRAILKLPKYAFLEDLPVIEY